MWDTKDSLLFISDCVIVSTITQLLFKIKHRFVVLRCVYVYVVYGMCLVCRVLTYVCEERHMHVDSCLHWEDWYLFLQKGKIQNQGDLESKVVT